MIKTIQKSRSNAKIETNEEHQAQIKTKLEIWRMKMTTLGAEIQLNGGKIVCPVCEKLYNVPIQRGNVTGDKFA